jgi:hypothetical protein
MDITQHAKERIRERVGIPKRSVDKNAEQALTYGVTHKEATGRLKKYFEYLFLSHGIGANIRLYANNVYIFTREKLITVLPLPNAHRNAVKKIVGRKRKENIDE